MKKYRSFFSTLLAITVLACTGYAGNMESSGGWEGDGNGQGYGYIGIGRNIPVNGGIAVVTRLTASYLYYRFNHADSTTKVKSPGISLLFGVKFAIKKAIVIILSGPELRRNREKINVANRGTVISRDEQELSAVLQGFVYTPLASRTSLMLLANYDGANQYVFSRLSIKQELRGTVFGLPAPSAGIDGTAQGNDVIKSVQAGIFIEISKVFGNLSLRFSGGVKKSWFPDDSNAGGVYIGSGFYSQF